MSQKSPIGKNELPWKMPKTPKMPGQNGCGIQPKPAVITAEKAAKSATKKAKKSFF